MWSVLELVLKLITGIVGGISAKKADKKTEQAAKANWLERDAEDVREAAKARSDVVTDVSPDSLRNDPNRAS
jgi:hypothetical protein